jgi:O-methyltransferase
MLNPGARLYLQLMKRALTRTLHPSARFEPVAADDGWKKYLLPAVRRATATPDLVFARPLHEDLSARQDGRDWPADAETMIGLERLENLEHCVSTAVADGVPGDVLEAGVWRGGASIFMRAVLAAMGDEARRVWVADSFEGLPKPDGRYEQDEGDIHWTFEELAIGVEEVQANFARYDLLDERVQFLKGWFKDTLPTAPIEALSVLRVDGDMYSSCMDVLQALYPKVSVGGFVIIDDYGAVPACRQAIDDYRHEHGIDDPMLEIDWTGVYWRRTA